MSGLPIWRGGVGLKDCKGLGTIQVKLKIIFSEDFWEFLIHSIYSLIFRACNSTILHPHSARQRSCASSYKRFLLNISARIPRYVNDHFYVNCMMNIYENISSNNYIIPPPPKWRPNPRKNYSLLFIVNSDYFVMKHEIVCSRTGCKHEEELGNNALQ